MTSISRPLKVRDHVKLNKEIRKETKSTNLDLSAINIVTSQVARRRPGSLFERANDIVLRYRKYACRHSSAVSR